MASKKTSKKNYVKRTPLTREAGGREPRARASGSDVSEWEKELAYFQRVKDDLLKDSKYTNKFIAIKNKKIIDSDTNEFKLMQRINKAYPDEVVLIAKVDDERPVAEMRSPRVVS